LTKALLTAGLHIGDGLGLSVELKPNERLFLYVDGGMHAFFSFIDQRVLTVYSFSVLPALSLNSGILHCDIVEGSFRAESFT
jgi:hypothetical protein